MAACWCVGGFLNRAPSCRRTWGTSGAVHELLVSFSLVRLCRLLHEFRIRELGRIRIGRTVKAEDRLAAAEIFGARAAQCHAGCWWGGCCDCGIAEGFAKVRTDSTVLWAYNQFRGEFFLSPRTTAPSERETQANLARGNHAGSL